MGLSRRTLIRQLAATSVAAATIPSWPRKTFASGGSQAGKPPLAAGLIRLDRTVNAFGPSSKVAGAVYAAAERAASGDASAGAEALRARVASVHGVGPDRVVVGCGSGEVLHLAVSAYAGPQRKIVAAVPTCELIDEIAERMGTEVAAVPLNDRYAHDLDAMLARVDASVGLVYICNPNNPTGTLTSREAIEAFVRRLPPTVHVVIDEAHHHYVSASRDYASFLERPIADPRVIVVRTFSNVYGLSGLRVGYGVAAPDAVRALSGIQLPGTVNAIGSAAAVAALEDTDYIRRCVARNDDDRQEFLNEAGTRMLRVIDSHTNFVMLDTDRPAPRVIEHFNTNGIAIAGFFPYFAKYIRVSLGTPEEMKEFWRVWDLMPRLQKMSM
jgi:histidinol-phosphate aminotransferase